MDNDTEESLDALFRHEEFRKQIKQLIADYFSEQDPVGNETFKDLVTGVLRKIPKESIHQSEIFPDTIKARHVGEGVRYIRFGLAADRPTLGEKEGAVYFSKDTDTLN